MVARVTGQIRYYIDFDNDGVFDFGDEITNYVKESNWAIGMHQPQQLVGDETRLELTLNNHDKRFSVELSTSPYYDRLKPQRRVQVVADYDGSQTVLYFGYVDVILPSPINGTTCRLTATGAKQYMQDQMVHLPLLEDVRADEILDLIVTQLHLPPAMGDSWILGVISTLGVDTYLNDLSVGTDFDTGNSVFPYVADTWDADFHGNQFVNKNDWQSGFRGYTAIEDVVKAEQGRFFFDRAGKAIFWARDHLQLLTDLDDSYDEGYFINASYEYGSRLYNDVRVIAYPRTVSASDSIVYQSDEPFELKGGDEGRSRSLRAQYTSPEGSTISVIDPFVDTLNVVAGSPPADYTVEFDARSAKFEFTVAPGQIYGHDQLVIQGKALTAYNQFEAQVQDALSMSLYGRRELVIDSKLTANENLARSIAEYNLSKFSEPRGEIVWVEFLVDSDAKFEDALTRQMGDRIRVSDAQTGHDAEYFIIGERHDISVRFGYRVTWYLEQADQYAFWILGEVGYSELGVTTTLGV